MPPKLRHSLLEADSFDNQIMGITDPPVDENADMPLDYQKDPMMEMPHLELNKDVAGQHFGMVDLRIERYPLPNPEKNELLRAAITKGVVGKIRSSWVAIGPGETIRPANAGDLKNLPKLPDDWMSYIVNEAWSQHGETIRETKRIHAPTMGQVFKKK